MQAALNFQARFAHGKTKLILKMLARGLIVWAGLAISAVTCAIYGQSPTPERTNSEPAAPELATPESATNDEPATFQSGVNLISVPVVVRDSSGKVIQDLKKEDFQLFDRGKLQAISRFTLERPGAFTPVRADDHELEAAAGAPADAHAVAAPVADHFTAYLFDDVHLKFTDLAQVRGAAIKHLDSGLPQNERAAIFTTSGQTTLEFTDNREALRQTLLRIVPRPSASGFVDCPDINFFMADAIENKNDSNALQIAASEVQACQQARDLNTAQQLAHAAARQVLTSGEYEGREALRTLLAVIERMSVLPGQRTVLLASPGFFLPDTIRREESDLIDRAIHDNVIVSSLDARGLYTIDTFGDISRPNRGTSTFAAQKAQYISQDALVSADVLAELAHGTGGSFFENSNDLLAGIKKLTTAPELIYVLWFSPENLKSDGSYHNLKVKLTAAKKLDLQARRGYYAPKHQASAEDNAKEQIRDLVFSHEEFPNPGVDLQTQFFKISETNSNLSVVTHVALKQLAFRKADGRNTNVVTVVSALFDRNGNFIKAAEKVVTLRLRDQTLEKLPRITVSTDFDVAPGAYVVRVVVRDAEGKMTVAQNGSVQIPY